MAKNLIANSFGRNLEMISLTIFPLMSTFERMRLTWTETTHKPSLSFKQAPEFRIVVCKFFEKECELIMINSVKRYDDNISIVSFTKITNLIFDSIYHGVFLGPPIINE
jgi:hypothetical protein